MKGIKWFWIGLVFLLSTLTACAPVTYDNAYYNRDNVYSNRDNVYSQQRYPAVYPQQIRPIEVTLYADKAYPNFYSQPVHFVIRNGEYIGIPTRDRRGRNSTIYAHYYQKNLHFDVSKNCQAVNGSSRFDYDKRWDNGYKYSRINVGKDYDLTGLQLQIRNVPEGRHQAGSARPTDNHYNNNTNNTHVVTDKHHRRSDQNQQSRHHKRVDSSGRDKSDNDKIFGREDNDDRHFGKHDVAHTHDRLPLSKSIKVSFSGGTVSIDGKHDKFKKNSLTLRNGDSREITLVAKSGVKFNLPVSYRNGTLVVTRHGDKFSYDPSWTKGKSYNIKTNIDSSLRNIKITVVAL